MLIPLAIISFVGTLSWMAANSWSGRARTLSRLFAGVVGLSTLAASIFSFVTIYQALDQVKEKLYAKSLCYDAECFILENTRRDDPILTLDPWKITWHTDRPTIMAPSGGKSAVVSVIRAYKPK